MTKFVKSSLFLLGFAVILFSFGCQPADPWERTFNSGYPDVLTEIFDSGQLTPDELTVFGCFLQVTNSFVLEPDEYARYAEGGKYKSARTYRELWEEARSAFQLVYNSIEVEVDSVTCEEGEETCEVFISLHNKLGLPLDGFSLTLNFYAEVVYLFERKVEFWPAGDLSLPAKGKLSYPGKYLPGSLIVPRYTVDAVGEDEINVRIEEVRMAKLASGDRFMNDFLCEKWVEMVPGANANAASLRERIYAGEIPDIKPDSFRLSGWFMNSPAELPD